MTNREYRNSLTEAEQAKWDMTYMSGHPLKEYINWEAFLDSEDGNEMNFLVDSVDVAKDIYGRTVYVLEHKVDEAGLDYFYVYLAETDQFWTVPCPEDGVFNFESDSPVEV